MCSSASMTPRTRRRWSPPPRRPTSIQSSATSSGTATNLPPFAAKNVCKTPLVGGQWRLKSGGGYDLIITDNQTASAIPTGGKMEMIA